MTLNADVIVVGAGSAGSILTRRLVDAGKSVLLFEAGDEDTNPAIHDVMRLAELWMSPQDWGYFTVPQKNAAGRALHLPRGRSEEHTSELQSLMRNSYAVFCLKKKT